MTYETTKWIYENDQNNNVRYVLGTKGNKPLLCFGINPSTAKPNELDNTLKSVERISKINSFDSWIMMNIYPQRATDPNYMHSQFDKNIHGKNLAFIEKVFANNETQIWAAWGTLIEKRPYLIKCLNDIYELSLKYNCNWVSIGKTSKNGHPHHPLYLNSNASIEKFKIADYVKNL